jgi:hypothetical protein
MALFQRSHGMFRRVFEKGYEKANEDTNIRNRGEKIGNLGWQ